MNLMVLLPLFLQEVFTQEDVVSGRGFTRLDRLDNVRPKGEPAIIYQSRSVLECSSFCAWDDACVAVTYHGGQCSICRSPLSSGVSLPGARSFNKQVPYKYAGCYSNFKLRWYTLYKTGLTPDICKQICYGRGCSYSATTFEWCKCGYFTAEKWKTPDGDCNIPCPGDRSKKCGGYKRLSVYRTV